MRGFLLLCLPQRGVLPPFDQKPSVCWAFSLGRAFSTKSTGLAQTTETPNKGSVGRLGCGRQAATCSGWSLRSNEPSTRRWGLWGRRGFGRLLRAVYLTQKDLSIMTSETVRNKNGVEIRKVTTEDGDTHWEVWKDGAQINGPFSEGDAERTYNDLVDYATRRQRS